MKASYKDIKSNYDKINSYISKTKNNTSGGGFIDKTTTNKSKRALKNWYTTFIKNKERSNNIDKINSMSLTTKGDYTKNPVFKLTINNLSKELDKKMKGFKSNKNLNENSIIKIFYDLKSALENKNLLSMFNTAWNEFYKNNKILTNSISDIICMSSSIITSGLYYSSIIITEILTIDTENKDFEKEVENIQNTYYGIITNIDYAALDTANMLLSIKNGNAELKKAIESEKTSKDKISKARESYDSLTMKNLYYQISNESYLYDDSDDFSKGTEEAIVVFAIILGVFFGLLAFIPLIRRAIYMSGTIKVDMDEELKLDVITIIANIESLEKKKAATDDPKEKKRIQSIIDKQQKFVDKYKEKLGIVIEESDNGSYEADYIIDSEDKEDEKLSSPDSSSSGSDDYQILI